MAATAEVTPGPGGSQRDRALRGAKKDVANIAHEVAGMKRDPATPPEWVKASEAKLVAAQAALAALEPEAK